MPTKFAWPARVTEERAEIAAAIIWTVYENPIESEDGRATGVLMGLLQDQGIEITLGWLNKTLAELEGGPLGDFITRDVQGKRTYAISCKRKPNRDPFPPDPREAQAPPDDEEAEEADEEFDADLEPLSDIPGVELELLPTPSRVDRYLYIVSLLNEMITEEVTAPERQFEERMDQRLTAVNAVLEDNLRLQKENDALREDKRKLATALEQANAMMRDQASRTNGAREKARASA